jgi:hypothetical protein
MRLAIIFCLVCLTACGQWATMQDWAFITRAISAAAYSGPPGVLTGGGFTNFYSTGVTVMSVPATNPANSYVLITFLYAGTISRTISSVTNSAGTTLTQLCTNGFYNTHSFLCTYGLAVASAGSNTYTATINANPSYGNYISSLVVTSYNVYLSALTNYQATAAAGISNIFTATGTNNLVISTCSTSTNIWAGASGQNSLGSCWGTNAVIVSGFVQTWKIGTAPNTTNTFTGTSTLASQNDVLFH